MWSKGLLEVNEWAGSQDTRVMARQLSAEGRWNCKFVILLATLVVVVRETDMKVRQLVILSFAMLAMAGGPGFGQAVKNPT